MTAAALCGQANMMYAVLNSNLSGQLIVLILLAGSVFVWTLMLTKWRQLGRARDLSAEFCETYRRAGHPVGVILRDQTYEGSPLFAVYVHVRRAMGRVGGMGGGNPDDLFRAVRDSELPVLTALQVGVVRNVAERTVADEALLLENNMGFLATAVTTAPFLGLLGTVWGVMDAFGGMAAQKSAQLSAVAPGISSALLTTVVGLMVALPSAIGYNLLSNQIRQLCVKTDNFAQELISDIETHCQSTL